MGGNNPAYYYGLFYTRQPQKIYYYGIQIKHARELSPRRVIRVVPTDPASINLQSSLVNIKSTR